MFAQRSLWITLFVVSFLLLDTVQAVPRRRSRGYSYGGGGYVNVAVKRDADAASDQRLETTFNYTIGMDLRNAAADRLRVFLNVRDEQIRQSATPLVAEVKVIDLQNSEQVHLRHVPVVLEEANEEGCQIGSFEIANQAAEAPVVLPARVYRLFVTLHREAEQYGQETAWGNVSGAYYCATGGETLEQRARRQIAMRTFREWYCTEHGWSSGERYSIDCHAYYMWATGFCTVGASDNSWTNLGALFTGDYPYHHGGQVESLNESGPIHGDYVRKPGHTFMLLAYDKHLGQVWTMEGNFNSSIEICQRSVSSGWTVGHLAEAHFRPEALEVAAVESRGAMNTSLPMADQASQQDAQ